MHTESPPSDIHTALPVDWRTITALNASSALAQMGQFGIGFVVLPLWLAAQGRTASFVGVFSAAMWVGMMVGMALVPRLQAHVAVRRLLVAGLGCSAVALLGMPFLPDNLLPVFAALNGLGLGLRWIALEPWLYGVAPQEGRGRLVGFHETLIAVAPIACPALVLLTGLDGYTTFAMGAGFCMLAVLPLAFATPPRAPDVNGLTAVPDAAPAPTGRSAQPMSLPLKLAWATAVLGGLIEGGLSALFPVWGIGLGLEEQAMAGLLLVFGIGGLAVQYIVGWLADRRGLRRACLVGGAATIVAAFLMVLPLPALALGAVVFLLGAGVTSYLTLAMIGATTRPDAKLAHTISRVTLAYTGCAAIGPLIAGAWMDHSGWQVLPWFVVLAALVLWGITATIATPQAAKQE